MSCRAMDDDIREDDEDFAVTLSALSLGTLGTGATTVVTIDDDNGIGVRHYTCIYAASLMRVRVHIDKGPPHTISTTKSPRR